MTLSQNEGFDEITMIFVKALDLTGSNIIQ